MSRVARGLILAAALPVVGYIAMKAVSPSPEDMRKKLGHSNSYQSQTRSQNIELMKVLQKEAGITDEDLKKKTR